MIEKPEIGQVVVCILGSESTLTEGALYVVEGVGNGYVLFGYSQQRWSFDRFEKATVVCSVCECRINKVYHAPGIGFVCRDNPECEYNGPKIPADPPPNNTHADLGVQIGKLVAEKQKAYGDSFGKSGDVMRILYPDGIPPSKLDDALTVVRILDKLFRIATDRDALGESPWKDVVGYGLLAAKRAEKGEM